MNEKERDDDDLSASDYLYELLGAEYAEENADTISQDFQTSGLACAMLDTHRLWMDAANEQLRMAEDRLATKAWAEAVFHAARALDGYASKVFIAPFRALVLKPYRDAFPHMTISENSILKNAAGLESGAKFLYIGIAATRPPSAATYLKGAIYKFLSEQKNGANWEVRNTTLHSLSEPSETEARGFVAEIRRLLDQLSQPLKSLDEAARRAELETENIITESLSWRDST